MLESRNDARSGAEVTERTVKRLLCCGFRRTGKAMGQVYQCWWRKCREIKFFLPGSNISCSTFLYQFVTYLLTLPRIISSLTQFFNWNLFRGCSYQLYQHFSPMHSTCRTLLIFLVLIIVIVFGEEYNLCSSTLCIFSNFLLFNPS
jgi:hypothetical protein